MPAKMPPDDSNEDNQHPPVEAEGDGGGGDDKPRRPTAVGAGDSDDDEDFMKKIGDLRHYDLDGLEQDPIRPEDIQSWPIPALTFVRIDGLVRSWEIEQENHQRNQQPQQQQDPSELPKRMYLMEDALTGLNSQKAYIAYAVIGSKIGVKFFMGMSLQSPPEGMEIAELGEICYDIQKSILHSVYNGVDIHKKIFSSDDIREMITPVSNNVGIVTGIASLKNTGGDNLESEQIERIANGLQGLEFGMLILAAPVPPSMVSEEELLVLDELHNPQNHEKAENTHNLDAQESHLKHIQEGEAIGHWQVGFYFFAPKADIFVRLMSLIKAAYTDEASRSAPLRTHNFKGLKEHLLNFALLRNMREAVISNELFRYKFLSPLNSRTLSSYIHLPKREMPGFRKN